MKERKKDLSSKRKLWDLNACSIAVAFEKEKRKERHP
jgi:hypothetical protein